MADFISPSPSAIVGEVTPESTGAKETAVCKKCKKHYAPDEKDRGYCKACIKTIFASGPFGG